MQNMQNLDVQSGHRSFHDKINLFYQDKVYQSIENSTVPLSV